MQGSYDAPLVLVSIAVAIFASYTALRMAGRVANSRASVARRWIVGGGIAMGTGIWSMHFIGMLAFRLPIPLGYDFSITALSLFLPIAVSIVALWLVSRPVLPLRQMVAGALLFGLGINLMHYTGMAAMLMQPAIVYDPGLVIASLLIAVGAAGAALWVAFRLRHRGPRIELYRALAAVIMGLAIVGMHYTGMAAAHFPAGSVCRAAASGFSEENLSILVILSTVAVLTIALLVSTFDAKLEARSQVLAITRATAEERQKLLLREQEARFEAERVGRLKDDFLATISHELRTPLNAILGWAQLLRTGAADAARLEKGLETIERNALAQAQLIDDLLDMNRIVSGRVQLDIHPLDLAEVARRAAHSIEAEAMAKGVTLSSAVDAALPQMKGDPDRLQQVLWNLLSNAVKFTPAGGQVHLRVQAAARHAEVSVTDSGIGIAPDFLPFVFDRFRQADSSIARSYRGLGLGLSIVRQLVELHGGSVAVHSEGAGRGSTFRVCLPYDLQAEAVEAGLQSRRKANAGAEATFASLDGVTALVVDDEPDAREMLRNALEACGASVLLASSAGAALEVSANQMPDILLSDIGMPGMDGFALIRRIRERGGAWAKLPAVALTAFTRREDEELALASGFDMFISKPVLPAELVTHVATLVAK
ncbi:MAG TPA: MHYT domain-containing protein [Noviherbaspirillum sp.]